MIDNRQALTQKEINRINDMWLSRWRTLRDDSGPHAQLWFAVLTDFQDLRGDNVVTKDIRDLETRIIEMGKAHEYLAALLEVLKLPEALGEPERAIMLTQATADQREQAIRMLEYV